MLAVLNKLWLSRGYHVMDPADAEPMALSFIEHLDEAGVPYEHYQQLYRATVAYRAEQRRNGKRVDEFSAELMVTCWPGLKEQLNFDRQNKIGADRQLYGESYVPKCNWCLDTNKILTGPRAGQICPHRD